MKTAMMTIMKMMTTMTTMMMMMIEIIVIITMTTKAATLMIITMVIVGVEARVQSEGCLSLVFLSLYEVVIKTLENPALHPICFHGHIGE